MHCALSNMSDVQLKKQIKWVKFPDKIHYNPLISFKFHVQAEPIINAIMCANSLSGGHTSFCIGKFP